MKRRAPRTVEELVAASIEIGVSQNDAVRDYDHRRFNRLFDKLKGIEDELRAMPGDQRRALEPLYAHPDIQVRLNAAMATLAIAP